MQRPLMGNDNHQTILEVEVLSLETISTKVIRIARQIWSDCIDFTQTDTTGNDEHIVQNLMAFYLAFQTLQRSHAVYEKDIEYIVDLLTMLHRRYISQMEEHESMICATMLFKRCCQKVQEFALDQTLKLP
jgi:CRISPR/Cas system type I-B associated protein Csh2 (Cas7 group RAMP superfamily)